jgi:acetyl esterase
VRVLLANPVLGLLARKRRDGIDRTLDHQVAGVLELQRLLRLPDVDQMEPPRARVFVETGLSPLDLAPAPMVEIVDTAVAHIPVRIYEPPDAGHHWIVFFHGGGGVIGSIRASEAVARHLAAQTRCTVASVDYRLGPEHPHPAAIDDAVAAFEAVVARVPAGAKVAVAGDSFGGFLSTQVDHIARERGTVRPPDLQVLIYPMVDLTMSEPSIARFADGYLLTRSVIEWFRSNYLGPGVDRRAASPQFWPSVRGAAPALVVTAGYDPLVDEGDRYVAKLRAAGVAVTHRRHPTLIHGFMGMAGGVRAARAATDELCADVVEMLG